MNTLSGGPFISEFHYDNAGGDVGEFIEVCAPAGTDAAGFEVVLYNGSNGAPYSTIVLDAADPNITVTVGADGNTYYTILESPIQNGAPDGIALVNATGGVCEFLSYEGVITATDGPASGTTSTSVGVAETGATPIGESLQIQPDGTWLAVPETPGDQNICFLAGTRILTADGYKTIESLQVGELVKTDSGKEMPIKWIGIQSVDINNSRNLLLSNPVQISANAIANGVPCVDLKISPNHAIHVDGLLINAGALVNDVNIFQLDPTESFKYYHIELDAHELIIAENTRAESYLPQNEKRSKFDNSDAFDKAYPDGRKLLLWPLNYPRVSAQSKVPQSIKNKLLDKVLINKTA